MDDQLVYLSLEDALELTRLLGAGPVRDLGLLDSAMHRPQSAFLGAEAYPTLEFKAAALLHSLAKNHPLVDGNKRLAWLATAVFLDLNGHAPTLDHAAAVQLVVDVAGGDLELDQIAARLRVRAVRR